MDSLRGKFAGRVLTPVNIDEMHEAIVDGALERFIEGVSDSESHLATCKN